MVKAFIYGAISVLPLILGALIGNLKLNSKIIAAITAFGSGVLIYALTFGLVEESFFIGGILPTVVGFGLGSACFIFGDYLINRSGGRRHKRYQVYSPAQQSSGKAIAMGAILDAIPESVALGIAIAEGKKMGLLILFAIIFNNLPEAISAAPGLKKEGFSKNQIFLVWLIVAIAAIIVTIFSYRFLPELDKSILALIEAFAGGSILAMLANSMIPEAYQDGGISVTPLTTLGFLISFIISRS